MTDQNRTYSRIPRDGKSHLGKSGFRRNPSYHQMAKYGNINRSPTRLITSYTSKRRLSGDYKKEGLSARTTSTGVRSKTCKIAVTWFGPGSLHQRWPKGGQELGSSTSQVTLNRSDHIRQTLGLPIVHNSVLGPVTSAHEALTRLTNN